MLRAVNNHEAEVKLSGLQAKGIFLNYGIDKHLASDTINLCMGRGLSLCRVVAVVQSSGLEGEEEVLALAHIGDADVVHPAQCVRYGLALRIQHSAFERYVDVGLHKDRLYLVAEVGLQRHRR